MSDMFSIPSDMFSVPSDMFSVPQAAEKGGVSPHTVRSWVRKREIQYYKLGRRVLISREGLANFLAKRIVEPGSLVINEPKASGEDRAALGSQAAGGMGPPEVDTSLSQPVDESRLTTAPEEATVPHATLGPPNGSHIRQENGSIPVRSGMSGKSKIGKMPRFGQPRRFGQSE